MALPLGTRAVAAQAHLDKTVYWVQAMAAMHPYFGELAGNDLLIVSLDLAKEVDSQFKFRRMIAEMAEMEVAAIACVGEPCRGAVAEAEARHLPLLVMPLDTHLRDVTSAVQRLIARPSEQAAVRGQNVARALSERASACADHEEFLAYLTRLTGHAALIQDEHGNLIVSPPAEGGVIWPRAEIERWAMQGITAAKADRARGPVFRQVAGDLGWAGWYAPVVVGGRVGTVLCLCDREEALDAFSDMVLVQAAKAWEERLARERAVAVAGANMRQEFVRCLRAQATGEESTLRRLARLLDFDLNCAHWAIDCSVARSSDLSSFDWPRAEQLAMRCAASAGWSVLVVQLGEELFLLGHAAAAPTSSVLRQVAEEIRLSLGGRGEASVVCGVGRPALGLDGLRQSLAQAEEAVRLARKLMWEAGGVLAFGDVAMYRLLAALQDTDALREFYQATIGPIARYDRIHHTDLLPSLEAYLQYHGNISRAAKALHVHRNTMIYRMSRIREVAGLDLDEAETRLSLQLSFRIARLLGFPR